MRRRRALAVLAGVVAACAAVVFPFARRERWRRLARQHQPGPPDSGPVDPHVLAPVAAFAGALFGHRLDPSGSRELEQNLAFMVASDGGWRDEFALTADYVERNARQRGASSFIDAPDPVRYHIVDLVMGGPSYSRRSNLLALVSAGERARRLIRSGIVPALAQVYRYSGPAWRARGYPRWPGVPGDPREYTRPGPAPRC